MRSQDLTDPSQELFEVNKSEDGQFFLITPTDKNSTSERFYIHASTGRATKWVGPFTLMKSYETAREIVEEISEKPFEGLVLDLKIEMNAMGVLTITPN